MKSIISIQEFLSLSALLNYQLSGFPVNWRAILSLMLGDSYSEELEVILIDVLEYLGKAYGHTKRRLGPLAVIHPIRAASLLARSMPKPKELDILTTLLHDKDEDLTIDKYDTNTWNKLNQSYYQLLQKIDPQENWFLNERIDLLARKKNELYYQYLGRVLDRARVTPELVRVKLADRLDNTMDLRLELQDETSKMNCFRILFDLLFVKSYHGTPRKYDHPVEGNITEAMRLYQLFKNSVFLSLLRKERMDAIDPATEKLFNALAVASVFEAQHILLHVFTYHIIKTEDQRCLVMNVLDYCHKGGITQVTCPGSEHKLDGLFKLRFAIENKTQLREQLAELNHNDELIAQAALAFMAIFSSFLDDPIYRVVGIDSNGIFPTGI